MQAQQTLAQHCEVHHDTCQTFLLRFNFTNNCSFEKSKVLKIIEQWTAYNVQNVVICCDVSVKCLLYCLSKNLFNILLLKMASIFN